MRHFFCLLFAAITLTAFAGPARAQQETLTNKSITDLTAAGFGDNLIIDKIEKSSCKFSLATANLVALKKAGVSEAVIAAMMDKSAHASSGAKSNAPAASASGSRPSGGSAARIERIERMNHLHANINGVMTPLEKQNAGMRSKMKALGYGGTKVVYEITGDASPVKVKAADAAAFYVNTGGAAPEYTLYKVAVSKGKRSATSMSASMMGMKTGEGVLTYSTDAVRTGVYKLSPDAPLGPGEYFFGSKPGGASNSIDVFAFSVE